MRAMEHCCSPTNLTEEKAKELLTQAKLNRTKTKVRILIELSNAQTPIAASEIHHNIGTTTCDASTIFRSLSQFKEAGLIREVNLGEDFFRYELLDQNKEHNHHHHHVRCRACGDIKLLENCDLSIFEKKIQDLGFQSPEHHLEFTGVCKKCVPK